MAEHFSIKKILRFNTYIVLHLQFSWTNAFTLSLYIRTSQNCVDLQKECERERRRGSLHIAGERVYRFPRHSYFGSRYVDSVALLLLTDIAISRNSWHDVRRSGRANCRRSSILSRECINHDGGVEKREIRERRLRCTSIDFAMQCIPNIIDHLIQIFKKYKNIFRVMYQLNTKKILITLKASIIIFI